MSKILRHKLRIGLGLVVAALLFSFSLVFQDLTAQAALPNSPMAAATLPTAANCSLSGTVRTCNLWAKASTISLPGLATPLTGWGYTDTATGTAQIPGPTLIVNQGETLKLVLTNSLTQPTGLSFPNQDMAPDLSGVAAGGSKTYSFTANTPGSSLYEAGLIAGGNGPRQVGMGLFGALVVRPAANPGWAYDASSAFDDEAVLIFSELDPNLNANPNSFDMHKYAPKYWLINGKAYPNTAAVPSGAGKKVLLRYLNAGFYDHSIGSLGLRQTVLGQDGRGLAHPYQVSAETLAAGQAMDFLTTVPPAATAGTKFALYSGANHLDNAGKLTGTNGSIVFGGMLTFLTVGGTVTPPTGPTTSNVSVSPSPALTTSTLSLVATITGATNVTGAEYFIDTPGANGSGTVMTGSFTTKTVNVVASHAPLAAGNHTLYVHGKTGTGAAVQWGATNSVVVSVSAPTTTGPTVAGISLSPNPVSGAGNGNDVAVSASATSTGSGTPNVTAAEFFIDTAGTPGTGTALSITTPAPTASITGVIPAATVKGLSEGTHSVLIRAKDAANNWGGTTSFSLLVDKTGPTTGPVSVTPSPNNGTLNSDSSNQGVKVTAAITDTLTNMAAAEAFIDNPAGVAGNGIALLPTDGAFNSKTEAVYQYIALADLGGLAQGPHTVSVHGKDAAGNWGAMVSTTLIIDRTSPTISPPTATYSSPNHTITLSVTASDPANGAAAASNIVAAEWFEGTDPGKGKAKALAIANPATSLNSYDLPTISTVGMAKRTHTLSLRVKDAAGNWSVVKTVTVLVN